jgi:hypothetical protein
MVSWLPSWFELPNVNKLLPVLSILLDATPKILPTGSLAVSSFFYELKINPENKPPEGLKMLYDLATGTSNIFFCASGCKSASCK